MKVFSVNYSLFIFVTALLSACSSTPEVETKQRQPLTDDEMRAYIEEWRKAKPDIDKLVALQADLRVLINELGSAEQLTDSPIVEVSAIEPEADIVELGAAELNQRQYTIKDNVKTAPVTDSKKIVQTAHLGDTVKVKDNVSLLPQPTQAIKKTKIGFKDNEPLTTGSTANHAEKAPIRDNVAIAPMVVMNTQAKAVDEKVQQIAASGQNQTEIAEQSNQKQEYSLHLATLSTKGQAKQAWFNYQNRFSSIVTGKAAKIKATLKDNVRLNRLKVGPFTQAEAKSACNKIKSRQYCAVVLFDGDNL
ncbi:SPOR domain-containing protein [Catenovulum sp. SM1970]|uniref:SPOR domain-containing protein n=1 Tax=Marinifaba aquimaris TaxID=2741323 RepID=UPI0015733817|nr:SPOR domain-containing protein [Marinifaba aquimaris]NTS75670.1 SPOR domain-containing protein [Marinifaba aquimaris]